jgi:hypothetical protein
MMKRAWNLVPDSLALVIFDLGFVGLTIKIGIVGISPVRLSRIFTHLMRTRIERRARSESGTMINGQKRSRVPFPILEIFLKGMSMSGRRKIGWRRKN